MLKAIDIHKSYDRLTILKGVSLEVKKGEIVSIVGASGAGKSTLLHILGTLDDSDQGYIEINNVKIESKTMYELIPVSWKLRLVNYLIDGLVIGFLANFFIYFFLKLTYEEGIFPNEFESQFFLLTEVSYSLLIGASLICTLIYYFSLESLTGKTLGKAITGTKVIVKNEGVKPGSSKIFARTLFRLIPFEGVTFFSKRPVGWHDSIANTLVIKDNFEYQKTLKNTLTDEELSKFRNKNIGMIFQFHNLLPEFTALENVCIPAFLGNRDSEEVKTKAKELLILLGLSDRFEHKPSELSGGEQQRVAIARALINNPVIVFADEPSGNLDSQNAEDLHKLFFKLRDTLHQTFVIVTHNEKLANMADRKLEMRDGKII